ncbi:MAG: glycoside hydrolase family 32 protein [Bacteroidota bacterium]|mgnify:CR=1 FL=1
MKRFDKLHTLLFLALACALFSACNGDATTVKSEVGAPASQAAYSEKHRPQFHFSPPQKWTNDPNGMVFFEGEYHLFYQHYPDSTVWGSMHWGHAVSKDLAHWENLPIAIYPDSLGYIFSGSAVVDWKNTSGFGVNGQPPLVAMYTYHDMKGEKSGRNDYQSQAIAFSNDKGRTWTKFEGNPVMPNPGNVRDIRDPKLVWDEQRNQWVVTLAVGDHMEFWASPDLKKWSKLSDFGKNLGAHGGVWECPDLFRIAVEGTSEKKWALIVNLNPGQPNGGSGTQYFIGNFDGKNFTPDPAFLPFVKDGKGVWLDGGKDNYAGVTWSDAPGGRRLLIGWMSNWQYANKVPTEAWRNAMTLPWSLTLKKTEAGYRLFAQPVKELEALRTASHELASSAIASELDLTSQFKLPSALLEIELEFALPTDQKGSFGVALSNPKGETYRIGFDAASNQFFSDRTKAGEASFSVDFAPKTSVVARSAKFKTVRLHLFFDVASAELFADGGANVMTEIFFPSEDFNTVKIFAEGGKAELLGGKVYQLKSIWKK